MCPKPEFAPGPGACLPVPRRTPTATALLVTLAAVMVSLLTGAAPAWAGMPARFVPEASSAIWNGTAVTVTFTEVGVEPGSTTTVAITATGTVLTVCRQGSTVLVTTRSSSTVTDTSDFQANADGTVTGSRVVGVVVNPPIIKGLDCTKEVTRSVTVTLQDLKTGAVLVVPGRVSATRVPA